LRPKFRQALSLLGPAYDRFLTIDD